MANENSIRLQGHEKFALREGWLTKGLNEVENPKFDNVFLEKDASDDDIAASILKAVYQDPSHVLIRNYGNSLTAKGMSTLIK